jgi:hypothetical protein
MLLIGSLTFSGCAEMASLMQNTSQREGTVGVAAAANGYIYIGTASSDSQARAIAANKGYSYYLYDTITGKVYAK